MNFWLKSGCMKWNHTKTKKKKMREAKEGGEREFNWKNHENNCLIYWKSFPRRFIENHVLESHTRTFPLHQIWEYAVCMSEERNVYWKIPATREKKNGISIEKHPPRMETIWKGERKLLFASKWEWMIWDRQFLLFEWKSMWKWMK